MVAHLFSIISIYNIFFSLFENSLIYLSLFHLFNLYFFSFVLLLMMCKIFKHIFIHFLFFFVVVIAIVVILMLRSSLCQFCRMNFSLRRAMRLLHAFTVAVLNIHFIPDLFVQKEFRVGGVSV